MHHQNETAQSKLFKHLSQNFSYLSSVVIHLLSLSEDQLATVETGC